VSTQLHDVSSARPPHGAGADHFAAFSFVDAITRVQSGGASGRFHVPSSLEEFPSCLVAEAIGQLAAWVSMAELEFGGRPVAALAGETRFHAVAPPGSTLELSVKIDSCDAGSVSYGGIAHAEGVPVLELERCLGPMLPAADFDDPELLRARFELLCDGGAQPDRFTGVHGPQFDVVDRVAGESVRAVLTVPEQAAFFADHFPRRPVFPATLLLNEQMKLAAALLEDGDDGGVSFAATRMLNVKMRAFILPGQSVDLQARVREREADSVRVAFNARIEGKTVSTSELELRSVS
jgi:3-hydroxymyristoyl/3-hydroxydecanoyl-(acyl carrier protein) dehydratase